MLLSRATRYIIVSNDNAGARPMRRLASAVRDEWKLHGEDWTLPGFRAMAVYRFGEWVETLNRGRRPLRRIYTALYRYHRNHYGIELSCRTRVGAGCRIVHQHGITIHPKAIIGDNCVILQNVAIGVPSRTRISEAPILGDDVFVGAGAVIIGRIKIGDGATIGPNSVVTSNVPAGATVFGNPARVILLSKE